MGLRILTFFLFFTAATAFAQSAEPSESASELSADVLVYSASPSGIFAAIQAAKGRLNVVLVEPSDGIGGSVAQGGNSIFRVADQRAFGGLAKEFSNRLYAAYCNRYGQDSAQSNDSIQNFLRSARFEPKLAKTVFTQMLKTQKSITLMTGADVSSVKMNSEKFIVSAEIVLQSGERKTCAAKVFIDASYTADLGAKAGLKFAVGRESENAYSESLAGFRSKSFPEKFQTADENPQAFAQFLILTKNDANKVKIEKPADYDAELFSAQLSTIRQREANRQSVLLQSSQKLPNGKVAFEGAYLMQDMRGFLSADAEGRAKVFERQRNFALSYLWFLQNDERLSAQTREEAATLGLAKDEFEKTANVPPMPFMRETRKLIGQSVMTQDDIFIDRIKFDSVGVCATQTTGAPCSIIERDGELFYEGRIPMTPYPLFEIPYSALVPKEKECANIIIPVCLSTSHVVRIPMSDETVFMALGQAVGEAARLAVESGCPVQKIDIRSLKSRLNKSGAVTELPPEFSAEFTWKPQNPKVSEAVEFAHTPVSTKEKPVKYYWDFDGDGTPDEVSTTAKVAHAFAKNKNHVVTLVIEDENGKRSKCASKIVPLSGAESSDFFIDTENPASEFCDFKTNCEYAIASESQLPYFGNNFRHDAHSRFGRLYVEILPKNLGGKYGIYLNTTLSGSSISKAIVVDADGTHEIKVNFKLPKNPYGMIKVGTFNSPTSFRIINDSENKGTTVFDTYRFIRED